jgi:hypothetical protein
MFIPNGKAARITNIPVVKFLDGGGSKVAFGHRRGHCWWTWTIRRSDYSAWDKNCTHPSSHFSKWIGTTSTTTGTLPSAALTTAPTVALIETTAVNWGTNVRRLDGGCITRCWHSRLLIQCHYAGQVVHNCWICNMRGWSTVMQ